MRCHWITTVTIILAITVVLASCRSSLMVQATQNEARSGDHPVLAVVEGNDQVGVEGQELKNPLRLTLTNTKGNKIPGASVTFTVLTGGGSLSVTSANTNDAGEVTVWWTIGSAGTPQKMKASHAHSGGSVVTLELVATSLTVCDAPKSHEIFQDGDGTSDKPFIICNALQLASIGTNAAYLDKEYRLERDLDLASYDASTPEKTFTRIGRYHSINEELRAPFKGVFDGQNHTIDHFVARNPGAEAVGLFNAVEGATVRNLRMTNAQLVVIDQSYRSAPFIGFAVNPHVANIRASGTITSDQPTDIPYRVGGLIGEVLFKSGSSDITDCITDVAMVSGDIGGGVVGGIWGNSFATLTITEVRANGAVSSTATPTGGNTFGGAFGYINLSGGSKLTITDSSAHGNVRMNRDGAFSGGFIGTLTTADAGTEAIIKRSYAANDVSAELAGLNFLIGGFVGTFSVVGGSKVAIESSYFSGNLIATRPGGGVSGFGGFAGGATSDNTGGTSTMDIKDCFAIGTITTSTTSISYVGGFAGTFTSAAGGQITLTRTYASVTISASGSGSIADPKGGYLGYANDITKILVSGSYYNSSPIANGVGWAADPVGLSGKSATELKQQSTFVGWDFNTTWSAHEGESTPTLRGVE